MTLRVTVFIYTSQRLAHASRREEGELHIAVCMAIFSGLKTGTQRDFLGTARRNSGALL